MGIGSGGHNRSHRTIEDYRRVDSFALRRFMDNTEEHRWADFGRAAIYCDFVTRTVEIAQGSEYRPLKLDEAGGSEGTPIRLYFRCPRCDRRARYLYNYHGYHVCRQCLGANYVGQQRNRGLEAIRRLMQEYWDLQDEYARQFLKMCGAFLPAGWEKEIADLM